MSATTRKLKDLGPMHDLLLRACPPDENGIVSIPILADHLGCEAATLYRWMKVERIPPARVVEIVEISGGRVERDEFDAYVFG